MTSPARILIVDDHPLVRAGIRQRLEAGQEFCICGEAEDVAGAMKLLLETNPDLAIVDLSLREGHGLDLVERMLTHQPGLKILVVSMHDEQLYAERALRAGAAGYLPKSRGTEDLLHALRTVQAGRFYAAEEVVQQMLSRQIGHRESPTRLPTDVLTARELEVFEELGRGATVADIAESIRLSPKTVETYRDRIRRKLDIASAHELHHYAFRWVHDHLG